VCRLSQIKDKVVLLHSIIGLLIGYFILHPISMVIYWFELESNSTQYTFSSLIEIIIYRFQHSFEFHMSPMGILFSVIGCGFGVLSGLYSRSMAKRMALTQINKQLIEFETIKSKFLQIISHEIRTPLNGIVGSLHLLKDINTSDELSTILEMLDTSVSRLETFSITALKITELQSRTYNLKKEEINLIKEIESQLTDLSGKIHERGVRIKRSNIPEHVAINGNLNLVRICLNNILDNAVKYCTENGEIEIRVYVENQFVTCEIIDDGVGFSEETLNNLFTLFSTAGEHVDNSPGLVFPLLKLIMEAHEGKLEVKNALYGGAIVKLTFPIDPVK